MITAHVFIAISLDGFIARDDGDISWLLDRDDPTEDHGYTAFIADKDAIVMGRDFELANYSRDKFICDKKDMLDPPDKGFGDPPDLKVNMRM